MGPGEDGVLQLGVPVLGAPHLAPVDPEQLFRGEGKSGKLGLLAVLLDPIFCGGKSFTSESCKKGPLDRTLLTFPFHLVIACWPPLMAERENLCIVLVVGRFDFKKAEKFAAKSH